MVAQPNMKLVSPNGDDIIGIVEVLVGVAGIDSVNVTRNADGTYAFEYQGETRVDWNSQAPKREAVEQGAGMREERVFECTLHRWWREGQLQLVPIQ